VGFSVRVDSVSEWYDDTRQDDVVLVFRGASRYETRPSQLNIMWNINHPDKITLQEYNSYDLVLVASNKYAEVLAQKCSVPVRVMHQFTDPQVFFPKFVDSCQTDLLFVGNSRHQYRYAVKACIEQNLKVDIYGGHWEKIIPAEYVKGDYINQQDLSGYYHSARIVLNDHWDTMRAYGFVSNRVYDVGASGGFLLSDNCYGLSEMFGDAVATFDDSKDLKSQVEYFLNHPEERLQKAEKLREIVLRSHTLKHRVEQLVTVIDEMLKRGKTQNIMLHKKALKDGAPARLWPKFSIVMANYNKEKYVAQAIESLLRQDTEEWELIIVDDCSTDNSRKIIESYLNDSRIKLIKQPVNRGKSAALKAAIAAVRSDYFGVLDSDDVLAATAVSTMHQGHLDNPDCGFIYSQFAYCDERLNLKRKGYCGPIPPGKTNYEVDKVSAFRTFKLCDYLKTEGYDETIFSAIDKDIVYKMEEVTKLKFVDKVLYFYRELPLSLSRGSDNRLKAKQSMQRVREAALARRRQRMRSVPVDQNPTINSKVAEYFNAAVEEYKIGNMVTAQRLDAQYKKAMDYDQLNVICGSSREEIPLLSVVMVTYNRPNDVQLCIEALRRQEYQDFEIVVVDNGDVDKKAAALAGSVDVYVDCPMNFNLSEGRNIGAHFANGQILVFLDDDALVGPEYLESIRKAFQQYEILGLRGRAFPKNGQKSDERIGVYDLGEEPFASLCNQEGNSAFRRDAYLAVGGMDTLLFGHEGSDLSYRLMQRSGYPSAVIYWPQAVIHHDYGSPDKFAEKEDRYARNRNYLRYKYDIDVIGLKEQIQQSPLRKNQSGQLLPPLPPMQPTTATGQTEAAPETDGPKISIVMACHNAAEFLAQTMGTILAQTLKEWELLVTDDGSTDTTRQILETYAAKDQRIRLWFFDDQKGPYVRRNFAIEQSKAPFICVQDADDLMAANKLETLYEEINRDQRLGIVGSFYRRFLDTFRGADFGDRMEKRITHEELMAAFPNCWHLCWHGSAIIRKSLFETIGLYDEQPYGSDTFWLSKVGLYGLLTGQVRFKNLPEFLTYKREHAQSQTGKISPADPRSRRHRLERYYLQKLQQIAEEAKTNPSIDAVQRIRECTCTDFIPKFEHLFAQWESVPVNDTMIQGLINRGLSQFSSEQYVSALITLNCLDQIVSGGCQSYRNLNFTRGLAHYAGGDDEKAIASIQKEIQLFRNQNAQTFLTQYLKAGNSAISAADRRAHIRRFIAEAFRNTTANIAPSQGQLTDPSSALKEKLALGQQYLCDGKSEEALRVYQDLLSDNMLAGHIELQEKIRELVEGIRLAKTPQTSSPTELNVAASGK
jgi:glycosyltransferase involved in cell wall biosynthesis